MEREVLREIEAVGGGGLEDEGEAFIKACSKDLAESECCFSW